MLAWFRKLLANWIARVFFGALVIVFVFWGISNVATLVSSSTTIATVAGHPVDISAVQAEYQNQLNQAEQKGAPDAGQRQQIAQSALAHVVRQHALAAVEASLGIVAPDAAVRAQIDGVSVFQTNGVFDQEKFNQVLQQNGYTPDRFVNETKADLANQQLVTALTAGAAPPASLVAQIYAFISQARTAETVAITTATQAAPAAPGDAVLRRYWKNHADKYAALEYRTIKLVILSPDVLAPTEPVSDAELQAAYARVAATETVQASRGVEVITVDDPAKAAKLAADWKAGASWDAMQAEAKAQGAVPIKLDHTLKDQLPSQPLADAVFSAPVNQVIGPKPGAFGYFVFEVTNAIKAGAPPFSMVSAQLKQQLQMQKAQAVVNQNVDNVQDALAGQTPLDRLPGNLGLTAVQGTLDATGKTLDGSPAPIPGGDALRAAILKAMFAAHAGDPAQLITGPANSYFAFTIDKITPPAPKPYAQVQAQVTADWTQDALSREAEQKAASLLRDVNSGKSLDDAAAAAGLSISVSAPVTRGAAPSGLPASMVPILFSLKQGQATMQPTPDGFLVAVLTKIDQPPESAAADEVTGITQSLAKSLQNDVAQSFLGGLQSREHVTIDQKMLAQIYQ
jgi:peptidyl-prolyl cis-trans isomerase D